MNKTWLLVIGLDDESQRVETFAVTSKELFSDQGWCQWAGNNRDAINKIRIGQAIDIGGAWNVFGVHEMRWKEVRRLRALGLSATFGALG